MQEQDLDGLEVVPNTPKKKWIVLVVTVVLLLLVLGGYLVIERKRDMNEQAKRAEFTELLKAAESVQDGQYVTASREYSGIEIDEISSPLMKIARAQGLSRDPNGGLESAYMLLREVLEGADSTDAERAYALGVGLHIYSADNHPNALSYLLQSSFFEGEDSVRTLDDRSQFKHIAEMANELYPTSMGKLREAFWYAQEILDNQILTPSQKDTYVGTILDLISQSRDLEPRDRQLIPPSFVTVDVFLNSHFRFFLLGAMSTYDENYISLFEEEFAGIEDLVLREPRNIYLNELVSYSYFYYAGFLSMIDREQYADKISKYTDLLITEVDTIQNQLEVEHAFISFMRREYLRQEGEQTHNYRFFHMLVSLSPDFKDFIESHISEQ